MTGKKQENKQRVTLLTEKEKAAAKTGGALNTDIPEKKLRAILAKQSTATFDADVILTSLANAMGSFRFGNEIASVYMTNADDIKQANETAAVVQELITRLLHMSPTVSTMVSETLWVARREFAHSVIERINPDLYMLQAALNKAASEIEKWPTVRGARPKHDRNALIRKTYQLLRNNSSPRLSAINARTLTRELLNCCGIHAPEDDRELARITGRATRG